MKDILITLLRKTLKLLARLTLKRHKPRIVGVTGSVGKTSAKLAIMQVLSGDYRVRASAGNFNNELGLPLTILGNWQALPGPWIWPWIIIVSLMRLVVPHRLTAQAGYPDILVLEYAIDKPGDMGYLLDIARPDIAVVTAMGEIPAHVEFFSGPDAVAREKGKIVERLLVSGHAILNYDDKAVLGMRDRTRANVATFGFDEQADVQITSFEHGIDGDHPRGIAFKLEYKGSFVPVRLENVFGRAQAYAAAAAAATALMWGSNLVKISESLQSYMPPPHRMQFLPGVKHTYILDDSYNAGPLSMDEALHVLQDLPGKRKIVVLGDMLEIGKYTIEAHERVGQFVANFADKVVTVGPRAKFIAEAALGAGCEKKDMLHFDTADQATKEVEALLEEGDLVLVKASRAIELDKVVEEIRER